MSTDLSAVKVGQDIESVCSKCGDVWHVVVAAVEGKLVKVECKECGAVHRYKDPQAAAKKSAPKKAGAAKKSRSPAGPPRVEADLSKPVRPYSARETFVPGERVQHGTFGEGVVQHSPGPGKIEILFGTDRKLLAQAKPATREFTR